MGIAVVFPGQGSQFPELLDPWRTHPASAAVIDEASDVLGFDLAARCHEPGALDRTDVTQLAVFTADVSAFKVLEAEGLEPVAAAGHSLGEFAALVATGATSLAAALDAVRIRAEAMQEACTRAPGTMLAIMGITAGEAAALAAEAAEGEALVVANENSPKQTVLSGTEAAIERLAVLAKEHKARPMRLPVAGAFHSPLMASAVDPVADAVGRMDLRAPRFPLVPNVSAEPTQDPVVMADLLRRHVVSPVLWTASVHAMARLGADTFVEAGPGNVLTGMIRRCLDDIRTVAVGTPDEARAVARGEFA
jgi:[acyl-carrier-protein] S-malonyltransferase